MSELLDQVLASVAAKGEPTTPKTINLATTPSLPPEAERMRQHLIRLHPGMKIEIEHRIFMRVINEMDLCIDVRNLPDQ